MVSCSDTIIEKLTTKLNHARKEIPINIDSRVPAAVLIPFLCVNGEWNLLFTKRTNDVATHQGEISFPGGAVERTDTDLIETALRETSEEIGIKRSKIKVLGTIDPVPTVSNYCVLPVIAVVDWPIKLILNKNEVEKTIIIPIQWLMQAENWYQSEFFYTETKSKTVIHYKDYDGDHLWGLTALLTQKTLRLL